jgi:hypothetical protein
MTAGGLMTISILHLVSSDERALSHVAQKLPMLGVRSILSGWSIPVAATQEDLADFSSLMSDLGLSEGFLQALNTAHLESCTTLVFEVGAPVLAGLEIHNDV